MPEPADLGGQADHLIALVGRLMSGIDESNDRIAESNDRIAELGSFGKHSRRLIRVLAFSVVLDVLLSFGLAFALTQSSGAAHDAERASVDNAVTIRGTCLATNDARARQVQLWEYILSFNPATTPEAQAKAAQFRAFVNETFKPRDCGP